MGITRQRVVVTAAVLISVIIAAPGVMAALSPAANEIAGLVWLDLDADGVRDPGENGFRGAEITLFDAADQPVGTPVITPAGGTYSFAGLDPAATYRVRVTRATSIWPDPSNWVVSTGPGPAGRPYLGTDNDVTALADIRVGEATGVRPGATVDAAIRPRPELNLGLLNGSLQDGTEPFNLGGTCATPTATAPAGDDCGPVNGQLRSGDVLTSGWSISLDNFESGTASWGDVVFEQTIVPTGGANVSFEAIPTACQPPPGGTGGTGPPTSAIVSNPDGSVTLRCNLGPFEQAGLETVVTSVTPSNLSPGGSGFSLSQRVVVTGERAVPMQTRLGTGFVTSARPRFDLAALGGRNVQPGTECVDSDRNPSTPCESVAGQLIWMPVRMSHDRRLGTEAVRQPVTFTSRLTAAAPGGSTESPIEHYLHSCAAQYLADGDLVYGTPQGNPGNPNYESSTNHSGTCTGQRTGGTNSDTAISVNGADLAGRRYPTRTNGGTPLTTGPFIATEHVIVYFIPNRSIDALDGTIDNAGSVDLYHRLTTFDPTGVSGASNYGEGTEPGYCTADGATCDLMPNGDRSNNVVGPMRMGLAARSTQAVRWRSRIDAGTTDTRPSGSLTNLDGNGIVESRDASAAQITIGNLGTTDIVNPAVCGLFDRTTGELTTADRVLPTGGIAPEGGAASTHAFVRRNGSDLNSEAARAYARQWRVQYASMDGAATDNALRRAAAIGQPGIVDSARHPGPDTFSEQFGRFDGDWSGIQAADCADQRPPAGWFDDPRAVPGGIAAVNAVRAIPIGTALVRPSGNLTLVIPVAHRSRFQGGPNDGATVPAGTIEPIFGRFQNGGTVDAPEWTRSGYQPLRHLVHHGDRVTRQRFRTGIVTQTLTPPSAPNTATSTVAGNRIVWQATPSLTSAVTGTTAPANNVVVTIELPPNTTFNAACTRALNENSATATLYPDRIENGAGLDGTAAGRTRLTYRLGSRPLNTAISPIRVCTDTEPLAPSNFNAILTSEITADEDLATTGLRRDPHTVQLTQPAALAVSLGVDRRSDPLDDDQRYTIRLTNYAPGFTIENPTVINVLPWNGDGNGSASERDPATSHTGTVRLTGPPTATWEDGSTPVPGDPDADLGEFAYTADPPASVSFNPGANTSRWCALAQFGTNGCPASFAQVTAFRYTANYALARTGAARSTQRVGYTLLPNSGRAADIHASRVGVGSPTLPAGQFVRSNTVNVTILAFEVGDRLFADNDGNGAFSTGDTAGPAGVPIEIVEDTTGRVVATATTDNNGRWLARRIRDGRYHARIPATAFAIGGPLHGWSLARAVTPAAPDTNLDDDVDQHAIPMAGTTVDGGVRTAGTLDLTAMYEASATGDPGAAEPLGDNRAQLATTVPDEFTNLTLDLGLYPARAAVSLTKTTNGAAGDTGDGERLSVGSRVVWQYVMTNTGTVALRDARVTDDNGTPGNDRDDWVVDRDRGYLRGDTDGDRLLDPDERWVLEYTGTAVEGAYRNRAVARGVPLRGDGTEDRLLDEPTAEDESRYLGVAAPGGPPPTTAPPTPAPATPAPPTPATIIPADGRTATPGGTAPADPVPRSLAFTGVSLAVLLTIGGGALLAGGLLRRRRRAVAATTATAA